MNADLATPVAAFVAGLVTSLHCAGMCGPLVCAARAKPWTYQPSRIAAYTLVGALCGAIGQPLVGTLKGDAMRAAPWALAVVMIAIAFGIESRMPQPRWLSRLMLRARLDRSLGWLTPLLPCGPLWLMFAAAAAAGSWLRGGALLASYAAGTVPLLALATAGAFRLQNHLTPFALRMARRGFALTAAGLLVWRATLPFDGCCH